MRLSVMIVQRFSVLVGFVIKQSKPCSTSRSRRGFALRSVRTNSVQVQVAYYDNMGAF